MRGPSRLREGGFHRQPVWAILRGKETAESSPHMIAIRRHPTRDWIGVSVAVLIALFGAAKAQADGVRSTGVALMGYDSVAYFHQNEARPGAGNIALRWRGLVWHFASPENRAAFEANPRAFVPQFGGLCPEALTRGETVPGDPRHWTIRDGKLYFAQSADALHRLNSDAERILPEAAGTFRRMQRN